jgi:hypothetical protein
MGPAMGNLDHSPREKKTGKGQTNEKKIEM